MESIIKYIFEAGMLKRVERSGWWAEKVKQPETVAEHVFRTAVIAFILAKMEGENSEKICTAALFHDMHETRLGDMNKITARYISSDKNLEKKVEKDQVQEMPKELQNAILNSFELSEKEQTILKDADYLECAFQAKEYLDIGYKGANTWVNNIQERLKTKTAKQLHSKLKTMDSNSWWKGLKRLD